MSFVSLANSAPKLLNWHHRCYHNCNYEEFEKKADFSYCTFKASRLELASFLNSGRDSLGSSRTQRFFSMIAADVVWHPNCSFALLARFRRSRQYACSELGQN